MALEEVDFRAFDDQVDDRGGVDVGGVSAPGSAALVHQAIGLDGYLEIQDGADVAHVNGQAQAAGAHDASGGTPFKRRINGLPVGGVVHLGVMREAVGRVVIELLAVLRVRNKGGPSRQMPPDVLQDPDFVAKDHKLLPEPFGVPVCFELVPLTVLCT